MNFQVYVIENRAGRHYIGFSENVGNRVQQHNDGVSNWTRAKGPWKLMWISEMMSLSDARKLENKLKRQGRGSGFYTITGLPRS
jgi:putative endonuclease